MRKIITTLLIVSTAFIANAQAPIANAGDDILFCGFEGTLNAIPSYGTGVWSCDNDQVSITEPDNPQTEIISEVINTGNPTNPYFELVWTETNIDGTDSDTTKIIFARIPSSEIHIIPPKCFGEPATFAAVEDTLQQYTWNFHDGIVDVTVPANMQGGYDRHFVYWNSEDTSHQVSLITMNSYNCQSVINIDTVFEPLIPEFDITIISDTCLLGKGGIIFADTLGNNAFFWLNENVGYEPGTPFCTMYNIPKGTYDIRTSYLTFNTTHYAYYITTFGSSNCVDTIAVTVDSHNLFDITCPDDMIVEYHTSFPLMVLSGSSPLGGTFFMNGIVITEFDSEDYDNGIYTFTYQYFDESSDCNGSCDFNITVDINSVVQQKTSEHFSIFPNPTTGIFNISDDNKLIKEISIFDINGTEVYSDSNFSEESINIQDLSKGLYFIKILSDEGITFKKLVLE